MKTDDIEAGQLISFQLDQSHLCLELGVILPTGARGRILAFNASGTRISVEFGAFSWRAGLTSIENIPTFGEIESIQIHRNYVALEGDFGDFRVIADTISIEFTEK